MGTTSEYVEKMQALLKKWDADFDVLAVQGKKASADLRTAYHERIRELRAARAAAHETFNDLRIAAESANSKMHSGMDLAWESMRTALEKAFSDFRK